MTAAFSRQHHCNLYILNKKNTNWDICHLYNAWIH